MYIQHDLHPVPSARTVHAPSCHEVTLPDEQPSEAEPISNLEILRAPGVYKNDGQYDCCDSTTELLTGTFATDHRLDRNRSLRMENKTE
jgi:hypothetical protein